MADTRSLADVAKLSPWQRERSAINPEAEVHYMVCQIFAQLTVEDLERAGFGVEAWHQLFELAKTRAAECNLYDWRSR